MDEPQAKPSLADDPTFFDRLADLDHGMNGNTAPSTDDRQPTSAAPPVAPPPTPASTVAPPGVPRQRGTLPPSLAASFDALTRPIATSPTEPVVRRPLLDLFPPSLLESREPPAVRHQTPTPNPDTGVRHPIPTPNSDTGARHQTPTPKSDSGVRHETPTPSSDTSADAHPDPVPDAYEVFYGLHEKPFALTSDPRFFFHSTPHDAVSQQLLTAIRRRGGLVVLTGVIGTGKTTLCRTVIEQLDRRTLTSFVADPIVSAEELLKTILTDFGVMSRDELARGPLATSHDLSTTLLSFIESLAPLQASAVVIIDEAQNLPADMIEQVRILAEAADVSSLLQVILVGQPALATLLRRPEHKTLNQRVTVRCSLDTLPLDEIGGYVMHRLAVAGSGPRVEFDNPALSRLFQLSQGVPRLVNLLCERALVRGFEASASVIDAQLMNAAADDLDLGEPPSLVRGLAARAGLVAALVLCMLLGAAGAAWVFRDAVARAIIEWQSMPTPPQAPVRVPAPLRPLPPS